MNNLETVDQVDKRSYAAIQLGDTFLRLDRNEIQTMKGTFSCPVEEFHFLVTLFKIENSRSQLHQPISLSDINEVGELQIDENYKRVAMGRARQNLKTAGSKVKIDTIYNTGTYRLVYDPLEEEEPGLN